MKTKSENPLPKTVNKGAVCAQFFRCGKANCKCAKGSLHGPYFAHFARRGGKLVKRYVRLNEAESVAAQCQFARQRRAETRRIIAQSKAMYAEIKGFLRLHQMS